MTKATMVWIRKSGEEWICPPIVLGGTEFFKHEDKFHVLHWAEWQASLYKKATGRVKFPVLSGDGMSAKNMHVNLGEKAVARLQLVPTLNGVYRMNVYNIRFLNVPGRSEQYGIYFGYVFSGGEWSSVCTNIINKTFSRPDMENMSWSNQNVIRLKRELNFPENPFMDDETPPPTDKSTDKTAAEKFFGIGESLKEMSFSSDGLQRAVQELSRRLQEIPPVTPPPQFDLSEADRQQLRDRLLRDRDPFYRGQMIIDDPASYVDANGGMWAQWSPPRFEPMTFRPFTDPTAPEMHEVHEVTEEESDEE